MFFGAFAVQDLKTVHLAISFSVLYLIEEDSLDR